VGKGSPQALLKLVADLRNRQRHSHAEVAPNFNLFRILNIEEKEVSTHSAFIAHLLQPGETHGQGDIFLRGFLRELEIPASSFSDDWTVSSELSFDGGRLDIVLQSAKAGGIIVIENKINTTDHSNQLRAYREWLDRPSRKRTYKSLRRLVYLTPHGELAQHAHKISYKAFSYKEHIRRWLLSCHPEVRAPRVAEAIQSYIQTIDNITTPSFMKDDLDSEILNAIRTRENRTAALRIIRVGNLIKKNSLECFWDRGEKLLDAKIAALRRRYWRLDKHDANARGVGAHRISIVGNQINCDKPHPEFVFFQWYTPKLFRWEHAVTLANTKIRALPESVKLMEKMPEPPLAMPSKHGWDGYKLITDDLAGIERILEEEEMDGRYSTAFFEGGWELFLKIERRLRSINDALLHGQR